MSARPSDLSRFLTLIVSLLLLVAACGPAATPTPVSSTPMGATTTPPAATFTPTPLPPSPTSPATSVPASATFTPTSIPSTPAFTATSVPPTPTFTPTPIPPAPTFTPTPTPPAPTFTPTPTPPPPTSTPTPVPPSISDWRGEYLANRTLTPPSVTVRNDRVVDFDLAPGNSPAPGVPSENWSARWTRTWNFAEANYRFRVLVDDGARLWVNELLIVDAWADGAPREFTANLYLRGEVPIRLEYYNHLGGARIRLNWEEVTQYPDWQGSYFPVRDLSGLPRLQRSDATVDFNFGSGAPVSYMPADDFSARWTRRLSLDRTGTYRFRVVSDDGARLWIDGRPVIDAWQDGFSTNEVFLDLSAGGHDVRLEFYEHQGGALIQLTWSFITSPATATFTPTPIPPTPTFTPTPVGPKRTPTPTFTATPLSPTPPLPIQPKITLEPSAGPIEEPITVVGMGWPSNTRVDLYLSRLGSRVGDLQQVGQATTDTAGNFRTEIVVPRGRGWEDQPGVRIVARSRAAPVALADATYEFTPGEAAVPVPFQPIPADQERLALRDPTFLVLTSYDQWVPRFGPEPPLAEPAINWQKEIVIGAFLGAQPPTLEATVASIMRRGTQIMVNLASPGLRLPGPELEAGQTTQTLVRVPRSGLPEGAGPNLAGVEFSFVDATGRLLAQGTGPSVPLAQVQEEMQALEAPKAEGPAQALEAEAIPEPGALAVPEAEPTEGAAEPSPQLVPAVIEEPSAAEVTFAWLSFGLWILLVAAISIGVGVLIWRSKRQR